jgi:hypothetical protein
MHLSAFYREGNTAAPLSLAEGLWTMRGVATGAKVDEKDTCHV